MNADSELDSCKRVLKNGRNGIVKAIQGTMINYDYF